MKRKHKRLTFVVIALVLLGVAAGLVLSAFEENIVFFYSPTDIAENNVAEGALQGGVFRADEVLAKHDETYMPPEVAESLKKSGKWKGPGESQGKIKGKDNNK